jgi:carboxyl-terminal processing protease
MTRTLCLFLLLFAQCIGPVQTVVASQAALKPDPSFPGIAERFARQFPDEHLTREPIDDAISARALTNFLSSAVSGLDDNRVYFLASDIARFSKYSTSLDDAIERGDLSFAYDVFQVFKERVRNRCDFVSKLTEKDFDLEKKETFTWRRQDAPWPKDEAEWNDIWRKKIKNEYIQHVVGDELRDAPPPHPAVSTNPVHAVASNSIAADRFHDVVSQDKDGKIKEADKDDLLPPMESIHKRMKQFLTVIEDSDSSWVFERYLSAFAHAYDPHSDYMSSGEMEDFDIEMKLSLVGIGARLGTEDGAAKVVGLVPGGPAQRDGRLQAGDKIIAVGQGDLPPEDIMHLPLRDVVKKIRGEKGTKVVLTVIPASDSTGSTTKRIDLMRDEVKLEEQAAKWTLREIPGSDGVTQKLGVVTLPTFYANMKTDSIAEPDYKSCAHDVEVILGEMRGKGVNGVILDLRNNGGGSLGEVVRMTGLFIANGPVVQVKESHSSIRVLKDYDSNIAYAGPLVVLVNHLSASASEILAGALQDYGRAVIVGDSKTHGKGTVQTIVEMGREPKLGAIKVTNAMYYRISGGSTQLRGISADIVVPSPYDCLPIGEEHLSHPMEWDRVKPLDYLPNTNMTSIVSVLREKSEKRRATDPRFAANKKLLEQISAMNKASELPLDIESRRKLAETEKQLFHLEEDLSAENESPPPKDQARENDLVLAESLRILADLVVLQRAKPESLSQPVPKQGRSIADLIIEWMGR